MCILIITLLTWLCQLLTVVSETVNHLFTCDLMICIWNWFGGTLNI